jgi:hypothetical protein
MADRRSSIFLSLLALATPGFGEIKAKDPLFTLSERSPAIANRLPDVFPDLKQDPGGYWLIDFRHLASFLYSVEPVPPVRADDAEAQTPDPMFGEDVPAPEPPVAEDRIPARVRALDGRRISLVGYMIPVAFDENGLAKEFLIIRSPLVCCYGAVPAPNEWVVAKMEGKSVEAKMDVPLRFYGTLHVGEFYEGKAFTGLYRLDTEKVSIP